MLIRPNVPAINPEPIMRRCLLLVPVIALAVACDQDPAGPAPQYNITSLPAAARDITVMTQNLYVGADVDLVIRALASPDPNDDFPALLFAIETLQKTDFVARAEAIAAEIARARPHAVGLQEVSRININLPPLGIAVNLDFLDILQDALARRNLHYTVAATVQNIVAEPVPGVRLVDNDALLVDERVSVASAGGQNFTFNVGTIAPGVNLIRGWVWARVSIGGQPYTIVSSHPEPNLAGNSLGGLRALQVAEIVGFIGADERVVVMGDLNDEPGSPMYGVLTGAGYTDTWAAMHPGADEPGLTCCHRADLSDPVAKFDQRIDYIFTRGFAGDDGQVIGQIDQFGKVPADRVAGPAYPIWPSDHAGLLAALR
jgi:hypothetical protein